MIWTMTYLWKCILSCTYCLSILLEIATALSCSQPGDCPSGLFCHTGTGVCMGCDKCSSARGNLQVCEKECFPSPNPAVTVNPVQRAYISTIIPIVLSVMLVAFGVVVAVIVVRRRCLRVHGGIEETGYPEPSRLDPTPALPTPEGAPCARPDERPLLDNASHQP